MSVVNSVKSLIFLMIKVKVLLHVTTMINLESGFFFCLFEFGLDELFGIFL
jgi:hypothetical protein